MSLIVIDINRRCNYTEKEREGCPLPNCVVGLAVTHCPRGLTPNQKLWGPYCWKSPVSLEAEDPGDLITASPQLESCLAPFLEKFRVKLNLKKKKLEPLYISLT